jgi:uncharacterized protein YciI
MAQFAVILKPTRAHFLETILPSEDQIVQEHFYYLKELMDRKKLVLAGRCIDASFGLVIIIANELKEAQSIIDCDPAVMRKIFTATVHPFSLALLADDLPK